MEDGDAMAPVSLDDDGLVEEDIGGNSDLRQSRNDVHDAIGHTFATLPLGLVLTKYGTQRIVEGVSEGTPELLLGTSLLSVNGTDLSAMEFKEAITCIGECTAPVVAQFSKVSKDIPTGYPYSFHPDSMPDATEKILSHADFLESGPPRGVYLLKSYNHFSMEQERIVVITDAALYRIKYDFQEKAVEKVTRTEFGLITRIQDGPLMWGDKVALAMSAGDRASDRQGFPGVRIVEGNEEVPWYQKWNPVAAQPVQIFTSHKTYKNSLAAPNRDINHFHATLVEVVNNFHAGGENPVEILQSTIRMEGSVVGKVVNESFDRGEQRAKAST